MDRTIFHMVSKAPRPIAPFHHAVEAGGFLFVTGQLPIDPDDFDKPLPEGIEAQTKLVFSNLKMVLDEAGYTFDDAVMVRIFLHDFYRDYEPFNEIYKGYFKKSRLPARTTVGVSGLGRHALIEIDLICRKDRAPRQARAVRKR